MQRIVKNEDMNRTAPQIIQLNPQKELPIIGVRIIDDQFADDFIKKGIIHFSNPSTWRDPKQCSGKQLDKDEGCFCYSIFKNDDIFNNRGRHFERQYIDGGWKYYEKTNNIVGCCFYGVLKSDFKSGIMKYGVEVIPSHGYTIPYEYFQSFRDNYADDEHKKTVIVFDLWKLYNMIIEKAVDLGALREEIYISTVYYVNKHIPFCTLENFPFEFFLKDEEFSAQSELRIIIASHNIQFYKRLEELNNNLTLGDISSFSVIQDKYAFDLDLSIQGNGLIYKLAKPISLTLEQRSFKELVGELYQIKQNRLPGEPKTQNELDKLAQPIINHLRDKYGVLYRDDWWLYNVPYNEYLTLPDLHKGMCGSVVDPSD